MNQHSDEVQFLATLLPLNERGLSCHAWITCSFAATCIDIPRCIPLRLMNYKDALTHPINDKLTKAKLLEISHALQDHCLVDELTVIPLSKYYIDIRTRWQTHLNETRLLIKDVINLGRSTRQTLANAMDRL